MGEKEFNIILSVQENCFHNMQKHCSSDIVAKLNLIIIKLE